MNTTDNLYERIDAYLNGTLSETGRQAFEAAMQANPSFAEEVELQKLVHILILENGLVDIRRQVNKDLSVSSYFSWKQITLAILGVALLAGALWYWWSASSKKDTDFIRSNPVIISQPGLSQVREMQGANKVSPLLKKKTVPASVVESSKENIVLHQSLEQKKIAFQLMDTSTNLVRQESSAQQNTDKIKAADVSVPCPDILFNIHTEASCRNDQSGSIHVLVSGILGGLQPYSCTIDGKSYSLLTNLAAGTYIVTVQDSRGCISEQRATVTEKNCTVFKDYSFNPNTESWKFPFADTENGTLSIMDKSGNLVYKTDIINRQPYEWNGRSQNGSSLEMGSYLYIATFTNGESRQGYIILLH